MSASEPNVAAEPDSVNVKALSAMTVVMLAVLVLLVVGVMQFFTVTTNAEMVRKRANAPDNDLMKLRADEAETRAAYRWTDQKTGVVQVPVERAAEKIIQQGQLGPRK
jgi:hypothetical protein